MLREDQLITGHCYFDITYPDSTLTKPVVATYEYIGEDVLESDEGHAKKEYLFKFHPKYRSDDPNAIENGLIAYTSSLLETLFSIEDVIEELGNIVEKLEFKSHS